MKARELQHDGDDGWGSFLKLPPANDPRLELDHAILSYLTQKGALVIPPLLKRGVTKMQIFQAASCVPGDTTSLMAYVLDELGMNVDMDFTFAENGPVGAWRGAPGKYPPRDDTSFPLLRAAQHGNYATVVALLTRGADPKKRTRVLGAGAIWVAADSGFLRVVVALLDAGADANDTKRATGNSALHVAAQNGHSLVVQELIHRRADVNALNHQGMVPLCFAILKVRVAAAAALLAHGADVGMIPNDMWDFIMKAKDDTDTTKRDKQTVVTLLGTKPTSALSTADLKTGVRCLRTLGPGVAAAHARAVAAERSGKWHDALREHVETQRLAELVTGPPQLDPWRRSPPWTQMVADERRCLAAVYGPRGGDATISTWRRQPLVAGTLQPPKTQFNTFVNHRGIVYRYGGCHFIKQKTQPDDAFWAFDPAAHAWRELKVPAGSGGGGANQKAPGRRVNHIAVAQGGHMWVWGGTTGLGRGDTLEGGLYRIKLPSQAGTAGLDAWCGEVHAGLVSWEAVEVKGNKTSRPLSREEPASCTYRDKIYVFGGSRPGEFDLDDLWVFDCAKLKWSEVSGKGEYKRPKARRGGVMFAGHGGVYLYGGQMVVGDGSQMGTESSACFDRFDVETTTWQSLRVSGHHPGPLQETTALPLTGVDPLVAADIGTAAGNIARTGAEAGAEAGMEPHSVLLVHGYCGGRWLLETHGVAAVVEALGQRRTRSIGCPYKRQLFRFDLRTGAWTELEMIGQSWVLSTAQAFAVELGDGKLCIGSGYGMSSESRKVSRDEIAARAADLPAAARDELLRHVDAQSASVGGGKNYEPTTPEAHQDIFHVMVAPLRREDGGSRGSVSCSSAGAGRVSGGVAAPSATSKVAASSRSTNLTTSSGAMRPTGIVEALAAREVDRLGGGWAWDVHTKAAHVLTMSEIHYGSPTFRLAMRTPEGDFWPRADAGSVAPAGPSAEGVGQSGEFIRFGDGGSLFGRRVEVFGLQAAPALNGKHGRVGAWDPKKGRYMVSVDDGAKVVAIKPERLRLLARVPVSKISSLVAEMSEEQQMTAEVQGQPKVSVYAIMEAGENMAETVEKGGHGSSMDVYRGPISAEGMAVLECTGKSLSKGARCSYYGIATGPRGIVDGSRPPRVVDASQNLMENPFDSERQWHRFQDFLKLRDEPRAADALATFRENSPSRKAEGISHVVIRVHIDGLCGPSGSPGAPGETGFNGTPHSVWRRVRVATNLTMEQFAQQVLCPAMGWTQNYHAYAFRRRPPMLLPAKSKKEYRAHMDAGALDTTAVLRDEMWVGPVKSTALDASQKVWYVGGALVDDRKVFVRDVLLKKGDVVQWVYDLGDWWSHTIEVEEESPEDLPDFLSATAAAAAPPPASSLGSPPSSSDASSAVAHVVFGFGACPPDDCGGVTGYAIKVAELLGLRAMDGGVKGDRNDDDYDSDLEALPEGETNRHADPIASGAAMSEGVKPLDPTKRAFWRHLNSNFRGQKNWMTQGDGMAVGFDFNLLAARRRVAEALRAGPVSAADSKREFVTGSATGLQAGGANKADRAVEDSERCAVCGVTAGIKACSRCNVVKYCCRHHQASDWPTHKVACKQHVLAEEAAKVGAGASSGGGSKGGSKNRKGSGRKK